MPRSAVEERRQVEGVDARVDLLDGALVGRRVALLDNPRDRPPVTDDAAVAVGPFARSPSARWRARLPCDACATSRLSVSARQQRHIAGQQHDGAGPIRKPGSACSSAWPVPSCGSWTHEVATSGRHTQRSDLTSA